MSQQNVKGLVAAAIILLALAAIVLTGIAVVTQYGQATKLRTNIVDEVVTISSGAGTTANDELTVFTTFENASGSTFTSPTVNVTLSTGSIVTSLADDDYNVTYTYLQDSDATTQSANFVTGLGIFGAFCAVWAISIVGKLIVGLFRKDD